MFRTSQLNPRPLEADPRWKGATRSAILLVVFFAVLVLGIVALGGGE